MSSNSFERDIVLDLNSRLPERAGYAVIAVALAHVISANIAPVLIAGLTVLCLAAAFQHGLNARSRVIRARWSSRTGWWVCQAGRDPERMALEKSAPLPGLGFVLTWRRTPGRRFTCQAPAGRVSMPGHGHAIPGGTGFLPPAARVAAF